MKGLTPVILIALSVGIFYFYIDPQYNKIQALQAEQTRYNEAVETARKLETLRNSLVDQYNGFSKADLRRLENFLPQSVDDVRLVLDVDSIAEEHQISISDISIGTEEKDQNSRTRDISIEDETKPYNELALSFSFDATYSQFLSFIEDLESSLRVIDITEMSFGINEEGGNVYTFTISMKTYWVK